MIVTDAPAIVKPATFADAYPAPIVAEAADLDLPDFFDSLTDDEIEAMAGDARYGDMVDSGLMPW